MDNASVRVISLLDELEELVNDSGKVPFTENRIIDNDTLMSIIKDIRLALPRDLNEAEWVRQEKERIIQEAKEEYQRVIQAAQQQAEYLTETSVIKKEAEKRANALVSEAENQSRYIKYKAYLYLDNMLYDLQNNVLSIRDEFMQPMNNCFEGLLSDFNAKFNANRQEMKDLAERVQISDIQYGDYEDNEGNGNNM